MSSPTSEQRRTRRRGKQRVTARDVAARAGVATMTVSRVINQPDAVSERLRGKVLAAIEELGYVPNRFAGSLASQRTRTVPVVIPSLSSTVFGEIVRGANEVLAPAGFQLLVNNTFYSLQEEEAICRGLIGWLPEGMIIGGVNHSPGTRELLRRAPFPVVEAFELGADPIDINVGLSHEDAGYAVTEHLVQRGYRRIAFIGCALDVDFRAARRLAGHRRALADAALEPGGEVLFDDATSVRRGKDGIARLLAAAEPADAVFCANDELATGALFGCQALGAAVPDDVAIAGFNGLEISAETIPSITTVISHRHRMGRLAARAILDRIEGRSDGRIQIDVGFEVVAREST